jgi:alkanesulfonate monooxygenase SsuD/methylene tetrahydromethanopterin reductase-like flavin-dependent oxidoreductase (luciferase family)
VLLLLVVAGAGVAWWLSAKGDDRSPKRAARQEDAPVTGPLKFPEQVRQAPAEVRELYEFAARRPDVLRYMPCFCGCWRAGHRSNYDCFIDKVHDDGRVEIDGMGFT